MDIKELHHLMWRAGFGTDLTLVNKQLQKNKEDLIADIFNSKTPFAPFDIAKKPDPNFKDKFKQMNKKEKEDFKEINSTQLLNLNLQWQKTLVNSKDQLREKTALFWHDHFACFVPFAYMMQLHVNKLRENALGSFRDLLHIISKDAAMLVFLNNTQNKKKSPNENFAREVMELYTIGIGNYTENDIKEAAKAFTGWNYNEKGNFEINEKQHDTDPKTFMGITQKFEGEDIINTLLNNPKTAHRIVRKIYAWFVNENINEDRVKELAHFYFNNNYDTEALLLKIFSSGWFYEKENIGTKIKSPIELIVGLRRSFEINFKDEEVLVFIQKILGQILGHPPNVAGWKDGKPWIDSSTLLFRLKLVDHLFNNSEFDVVDKNLAETTSFNDKYKKLEATISMNHLYKITENKSKSEAQKLLADYFIICDNELANKLPTPETNDMQFFTIQFIQALLKQPEYQLS